MTTLAEINANALEGDCRGGEIELTGGSVDIGAPISLGAEGQDGFGGSLDVTVSSSFMCREKLDGGGGFEEGTILIGSEPGPIMAGPIMTMVTTLECVIDSGQIELTIECDPLVIMCGPILIGGTITAGPSEERSPRGVAPTEGGSISISGCSVEIAETAQLIARGPAAFNRITSRGSTTVAGDMTATSINEFRFRPGLEPVITGQVVPAPSLIADDSLQPCALPPGTPTSTAIPTQTASRTPTPVASVTPSQIETPSPTATGTTTLGPSSPTPTASQTPGLAGPGNANCDGRISAADIPELLKLIPSSDPGECGLADADQSGTVDELDIPATVRLIFE